jgi:cytochrome oxidase Cu insertion factor (SCO1/SenC/PrrC family)
MCARLIMSLIAVLLISDSAAAQRQKPAARRTEPQPLKVGQLAPVFRLHPLDSKTAQRKMDEIFDLKDFRDKKPVLLFFGSYT